MKQITLFALLCLVFGISIPVHADEEREHDEDRKRSGTFKGVVVEKGRTWIRVRPEGREESMRLTPHWRGGLPKDGGGLDKDMLEIIRELPVRSVVRVKWEYEERPRVVALKVLERPRREPRERDGDREKHGHEEHDHEHAERDREHERDGHEHAEGKRDRDEPRERDVRAEFREMREAIAKLQNMVRTQHEIIDKQREEIRDLQRVLNREREINNKYREIINELRKED